MYAFTRQQHVRSEQFKVGFLVEEGAKCGSRQAACGYTDIPFLSVSLQCFFKGFAMTRIFHNQMEKRIHSPCSK